MTALTELLRDASVRWDGTPLGLCPAIASGVAERLTALGPSLIPSLIESLSSEDDFAAAHVLLTRLTGVEYESMPTWNGLAVEILSDGSARIDPAQRFRLQDRWRRWFASGPNTDRLPPPR